MPNGPAGGPHDRSTENRLSGRARRQQRRGLPPLLPDHEPVPHAAFEDAFEAVQAGDCDLAMIPVENSIAGRVADVHHLLPLVGAEDRRRTLQADPLPADGQPGVALEDCGRSPACRSRSANAARCCGGSACGPSRPATPPARPRRWRCGPIRPAPPSPPRWPPNSTAWKSCSPTSRTRRTTPPASW